MWFFPVTSNSVRILSAAHIVCSSTEEVRMFEAKLRKYMDLLSFIFLGINFHKLNRCKYFCYIVCILSASLSRGSGISHVTFFYD